VSCPILSPGSVGPPIACSCWSVRPLSVSSVRFLGSFAPRVFSALHHVVVVVVAVAAAVVVVEVLLLLLLLFVRRLLGLVRLAERL